jgi:hypothetical protein
MTAQRLFSIGIMLLFVLAAAIGQNPEPTALSVGSASIAELKGDVTLHSPQGDVVNAQRGTLLPPDTKIDTLKGSVLLDLQDGSQVLLKSNSHVILRSPTQEKGYWLELLLGKINAKIQKRLGNTPSFRMGTPTAVITVRGTRFSVEVSKKLKTSVSVFEGMVEVGGFGQGPPVMLQPGFSTGVDQNRNPEAPHSMDGRERDDDERMRQGVGTMSGHGEDNRRPGTQQGPPSQDRRDNDNNHEKDD